eukprot:TRINITY_DN201_c0_g3_i1.p1 TRINITY_DN201_c0_g3~~TRINITY_DN201_c0_g3_i1.p1  ORF type:complete len:480 (-),score=43.24 TRINITY_DN201_c0_g3_i1:224-1663(-)
MAGVFSPVARNLAQSRSGRSVRLFSTLDYPHADLAAIAARSDVVMRAAKRESNARGYVRKFPISVGKAQGIKIWDSVTGDVYWDCLGCAGTLALGHNHPVIREAIQEWLDSGVPQQILDMSSPGKDEFITELQSVVPPELTRFHHCSPAGTDALDAAVKLCKMKTGRRGVMSFHGGYHGHGQGPLAMMGNLDTKTHVPGLMGEVNFLPYPYDYRNPFGMNGAEGERAVLKYIETILDDVESGIPLPACIVLEAIQGEGGVNEMSDWALQELRRITAQKKVPLILDEVQSGFCRSGDFFAFNRSGIIPDVLCMSKAIGGGMPMAINAFKEDLNVWGPGSHTGTFRGNTIAFACGTASIRYMKQERLWEKVRQRGEQFRAHIEAIQARADIIGHIRGRGLMQGIEIVDNTRTDHLGLPKPDGELAGRIQVEAFKRKLIFERGGRNGAVIRFLTPLIVTEEEIDITCGIFAEAVDAAIAALR